jgi:hypothetical protein
MTETDLDARKHLEDVLFAVEIARVAVESSRVLGLLKLRAVLLQTW